MSVLLIPEGTPPEAVEQLAADLRAAREDLAAGKVGRGFDIPPDVMAALKHAMATLPRQRMTLKLGDRVIEGEAVVMRRECTIVPMSEALK